mgnify:FL=1
MVLREVQKKAYVDYQLADSNGVQLEWETSFGKDTQFKLGWLIYEKEEENYISLSDGPALQKVYDEAVANFKSIFIFKGQEMLTSYGKYLLEYINLKNKKV